MAVWGCRQIGLKGHGTGQLLDFLEVTCLEVGEFFSRKPESEMVAAELAAGVFRACEEVHKLELPQLELQIATPLL